MPNLGNQQFAQIISYFLFLVFGVAVSCAQNQPAEMPAWRADHHVHLASPELCRLVGECLPSNKPPAVYASDAIHALDAAHVAKGVILSCAYLYGLPSLHLKPAEITAGVRRENEFVATQVAKYPDRLVGFFSVDPLYDSALEEIRHWRGSQQMIGLKLHFRADQIDIRNAEERRKVTEVIAAAAAGHLPMVIHIGGGKFNGADAELFIREVLPSAESSWIQIAHAGGGLPRVDGNNLAVLRTFADHIVRDDPATRHVLFDISYVPAPHEKPEMSAAILKQIRRIGMKRFLFGSDFNVLSPLQEIKDIGQFGLTPEELQTLRENCAPWACR